MSFTRLKTDINGGFPLVLDDVRVLQAELSYPMRDYLNNICPTDGAVFLSGGKFPAGILTIGIEGGVAYIKAINAFVNIIGNNSATWDGTSTFLRAAASTFDSAGLKTFQNGSSQNTYELPRYTINTGTAGTGDIVLNKWVYLFQNFGEGIVTFASGISNGNVLTVTPRAKYVSIVCTQIDGPAGNRTTDEDLFTINNTLFDPNQETIGLASDGNGAYNIPISISSAGVVRARFATVNGEYPLSFVLTYPIK
jgi:hypothetical protein